MGRMSKSIHCDRGKKRRRAEARQAEEVCPYVTLFVELEHEQDVPGHRELRIVVAGKHE